jgi:hypothetical protein
MYKIHKSFARGGTVAVILHRHRVLLECSVVRIKMKVSKLAIALCVSSQLSVGNAWSTTPGLFPSRAHIPATSRTFTARAVASATASSGGDEAAQASPDQAKKKEARKKQVKEEGGPFAFNTKYGALNPFAIYYGLTSILLGLPWLAILTFCQLLYTITGGRVDKRVSVCL